MCTKQRATAAAFVIRAHRKAGAFPLRQELEEAKRAGLRLALATTTSETNLGALFEPVLGPGWRARFEAIVTGDTTARKKPAPDVYLQVLERLAAFQRARVQAHKALRFTYPISRA